MKKSSAPKRRFFFGFLPIIFLLFLCAGMIPCGLLSQEQAQQKSQIEKPKIFQEAYPLISETDLYCSIFILEGPLPELRIAFSEKSGEKSLFADSDVVYLNKGKNDGLEIGQVFVAVEIGQKIKDYGMLGIKRGRVRVTFLEESRAVAKIEKSCGNIMVGNSLIPFEEKEGMLGKDMGFVPYSKEGSGPVGTIIYLENDLSQIAGGHWALIDIGKDSGLQVGQQMTVFYRQKKDLPRLAVGNLIVIDIQQETSTVKILSASDVLRLGYEVQAK